MKKLTGMLLVFALLILSVGCGEDTVKGTVLLREGNVTEAVISSRPEGYNYNFTGESAVEITEYLAELNLLSDFSENPNEYNGMSWVITLVYEDGSEITICHFGNMFIRAGNDAWYRMDYNEASEFDALLEELSK